MQPAFASNPIRKLSDTRDVVACLLPVAQGLKVEDCERQQHQRLGKGLKRNCAAAEGGEEICLMPSRLQSSFFPMSEPNYEPSDLEHRITGLFGKAFHYIVDLLSGLLKRAFKKADPQNSNPNENEKE